MFCAIDRGDQCAPPNAVATKQAASRGDAQKSDAVVWSPRCVVDRAGLFVRPAHVGINDVTTWAEWLWLNVRGVLEVGRSEKCFKTWRVIDCCISVGASDMMTIDE